MNAMVKAHAWIVGSDSGLSSKAIWAHMMDAGPPRYGWDHPRDPADFGRCHRLLNLIPEWKARLPEMATRSDTWARLVARWDEIAESMENEVGIDWSRGLSAPKTYKLMRSIIEANRP